MSSFRKALCLAGRLLKIAATNPSRLSHVLGTTLAVSSEVVDRSLDLQRFKHVYVEDLLPEPGEILRAQFAFFPKTNASISVLEFVSLVLLLSKVQARSVFEFGTYKGVSITQLAINLPADARIYTLDLPEEYSGTAFPISFKKDAIIAIEKNKGALVPADVRPRIQFLHCDSAKFDEGPLVGQIDFVFVDGAHNAEYVRNDSEKAWNMLRRGGVVVWHDCVVNDPDVVRYLLRCPHQPTRIVGTSLAFAFKP